MSSSKRQKLEPQLPQFHNKYYPSEITDKQVAQRYLKDENKPINVLNDIRIHQTKSLEPGKGVVHLFNNDLRVSNNKGFYEAGKLKADFQVPLIGLFVYCLEELYCHSISNFQLRFKLDTLDVLQKSLGERNIPLVVLKIDRKADYTESISNFMSSNSFNHLTANISYEVDELRDFVHLHQQEKFSFLSFHDTCVVEPGLLASGKGTQYSVFTPWSKAWNKYVNSHSIDDFPAPEPNAPSAANKFDYEAPLVPKNKELNSVQLKNYENLYEPGELAANIKLSEYLKSEKIMKYEEKRNQLDEDVGSHISHYIANGSLNCRTIVKEILKTDLLKQVDQGNKSAIQWVRQVSWRDFYKHVLCNWPHVSMFRPFHLEYSDIKWEYNQDHFDAWCKGQTGYPIIDASMRELNQTGFMSNRSRMIVASFISKHLLLDWRYGEQFFSESLIDCDFASNNGGWGFSSSTGVDPQPYFRIFNPYLQSERFDPHGHYIKKWVPELAEVDEKDIHQPYSKNNYSTINDYPFPIVEHKFGRERALQRYKEARY
ncbi:DNA photolyase phr1 [Yamadazyma tenuis]|uniref:Photolyase/cryptochrome alpha/beta domain-containing protein n=1 Tax=Candida tenuis (strain ATCC 10573 / BCRC 21748 / CBS 615 / JCM 9827 / NBRC 10315 / NRRL Y-1498 / VKM Y-70) TaxID=590646 RepID=G3BA40_CANTC|nr:uncharacterized protein CANTEDRAFT_125440 [Yamadazyma tenuis ATCC 10573]EGV62004.1 hypothetical protein CANTEDRAFT_125440 [Yamadazyma tenuis ATCC 10573]WEJ93256.1 DNA photolyase phr1 [Yamadazyma tenuis]